MDLNLLLQCFLDERNIAHPKRPYIILRPMGLWKDSLRFLRTVCRWPFYRSGHGNKKSWTFCKNTAQLHMRWLLFHHLNCCMEGKWEPNLLCLHHTPKARDQEDNECQFVKTKSNRGAQMLTFQVGNRVCICKAMQCNACSQRTFKVHTACGNREHVGPSLADGRLWHSSHFSLVPEVLKPTSDHSATDVSVANVPNTEETFCWKA